MNEVAPIVDEPNDLVKNRREIEGKIKLAAKSKYKMLDEIAKRRELLLSEENMIQAEIREAAGFLTRQLDEVCDEISSATARLKRTIHQLPAEEIMDGAKLVGDSLNVTVSKTQISVAFKSSMLADHPWISSHVLSDGSSAVEPVIKPYAIEELIRDGRISSEEAEKYKVTTKVRSPSVRITYKEK